MLKKLISILAASLLSWFVVYTLFHIPLTEPLAVHWTPEKPTQGWLQPDRLFIIVCTNQQTNETDLIRNLEHLKNINYQMYRKERLLHNLQKILQVNIKLYFSRICKK